MIADVAPGLYATLVVDGAVKATAKCPQKYICPGGTARQSINPADVPLGDPTIVPCPRGMWTRGQGSTVDSLCGKSQQAPDMYCSSERPVPASMCLSPS